MINRRQWAYAALANMLAGFAVAADVGTANPAPATEVQTRSVLTAEQVIQILDDTVDWYRTLGVQQQNATQPSDLLIVYANRQTADEVVALAFEIARANAELLSSEATARQSDGDQASPQALAREQQALDAQRKSIEDEMAAARQRAAASPKARQALEATLSEHQGELAMVAARRNLLDTMVDFVNESDPRGAGANALKAHIDAIAATMPSIAGSPTPSPSAAPTGSGTTTAANATSSATQPSVAVGGGEGLWDLGRTVLQLRNKMATIASIDARTDRLARTFELISAPPLRQLKTYSARSDALAAQADHAGDPALKGLRDQFDTLAWLFKQTSAILLPLSKEQVLLRQYRHNLANWLDAARRQYRDAVATLGIRVALLAGILAAVFVLGEVWRRAVLRFAHEARRRYQLLLVRKIVLWAAVIAILGLSLVSEISTFATFAGLLTAGLAVAMQSVLVSVVGYFFLIGKYGIRVGDKIQIGTVVGEVIDLGLVRMHLLELNPQGPLGPTGRVVAFANLIVFQPAGGLFKQIPGVDISWHETSVKLPEVRDYAAFKDRLTAVVSEACGKYREEIARQTKEIRRTTAAVAVEELVPQVQMHLHDGRMEALIRYPVHRENAAEIDERVSLAVLRAVTDVGDPVRA